MADLASCELPDLPTAQISSASDLVTAVQNDPQSWYNCLGSYGNAKLLVQQANARELHWQRETEIRDRDIASRDRDIATRERDRIQQEQIIARLETVPHPEPSSKTQTKSSKFPDPPLFGGKRDELETWLMAIRNKLKMNGDWYSTESAKLTYISSRLTEDAARQILPHYNQVTEEWNMTSGAEMLQYLDTVFGDPDRTNTAQRKLASLLQKDRSFGEYYNEFMRYSLTTGYNEIALSSMLYLGTSWELHDATISEDMPKDVALMAKKLQKIDNRIQANRRDRAPPTKKPPSKPAFTPFSRPMSFRPLPPASTPAALTTTQGGNAMDLSKSRPQGGYHISDAEKARRMRGNLCLRCGAAGHFASGCTTSGRPAQLREIESQSSTTRSSSPSILTPSESGNEGPFYEDAEEGENPRV